MKKEKKAKKMKVSELIEKLKTFDKDLVVYTGHDECGFIEIEDNDVETSEYEGRDCVIIYP